MSRKRVVDVAGSVRFEPATLASLYAREVAQVFRPQILPGEFSSPFSPKDAPLYVSSRAVGLNNDIAFYFEQQFHEVISTSDSRLVFVEGREGLGKSTFVRYYFDCFVKSCVGVPNESELETRPETLVLFADLRWGTDISNLEGKLFGAFMQQIKVRFPEISVENNFAMWEPRAWWGDPIHSAASPVDSDQRRYRADLVKTLLLEPRNFVECALWYLTIGPGKTHNVKIAVVVDNLDQLDRSQQINVLRLILHWATATHGVSQSEPISGNRYESSLPNIYRIVVPVRPETLREIRNAIAPLPEHQRFSLGSLATTKVVEQRGLALHNAVSASDHHVDRDIVLDDDNTTVYELLTSGIAGNRFRQILSFDSAQLLEVGENAPYAQRLLSLLSDGSVRRMLDMRARLIRSPNIESAVMRFSDQRSKRQRNYAIVCGILTGGKRCFDENDLDNHVLNLFNTCRSSEESYHLLLGVHVLHVMRSHSYSISEIIRRLVEVGYRQNEIEECLGQMREKQIFRTSTGADGQQELHVAPQILQAHVDLNIEPPYLDEMAMVTPVCGDRVRRMHVTTAHMGADLKDRVSTTMEFLRQIKSDQDFFCTWRENSDRQMCGKEFFSSHLETLQLPDIHKRAAVRYRKRLEALSGLPELQRFVPERTWNEFLKDPILVVNDKDATAVLSSASQ